MQQREISHKQTCILKCEMQERVRESFLSHLVRGILRQVVFGARNKSARGPYMHLHAYTHEIRAVCADLDASAPAPGYGSMLGLLRTTSVPSNGHSGPATGSSADTLGL